MRAVKHLLVMLFALASLIWLVATAQAAGPRNPYSSFNLSGINYGAQQWDRAQRQGKVVWPYYNVPSRNYSSSTRRSGVYVGGVIAGGSTAGTIIQGGSYRPAQRSSSTRGYRRQRR